MNVVGPGVRRLALLVFLLPVSAGVAAAPEGPCRVDDRERAPEVFLNANPHDRVVIAALDLLQPYARARPRAGTFNASDHRELPLANRSGVRISCVPQDGSVTSQMIYINAETNMYRLAAKGSTAGVVGIAATLVHEMRHGTGAGEGEAYAAEAAFVRHWLGTAPVSREDRSILERFLDELDRFARVYSR